MQPVRCPEGKEVRGRFFPESEQQEPKRKEEAGQGALGELEEHS